MTSGSDLFRLPPANMRLRVELPLDPDYAAKAGVKRRVSVLQLVVYGDQERRLRIFSQFIKESLAPQSTLCVVACNEFISLNELADAMPFERVAGHSEAILVSSTSDHILGALSLWRAEEHILFGLNDPESAQRLISTVDDVERKWWKWNPPTRQALYLEHLETFDLLFFYAESHESLETYGSERTILGLFDKVRDLGFTSNWQ